MWSEAWQASVSSGIVGMIEGRNIVCIASNWWYDPTSKHHVMKLLAERNHVVWVNYHGSRRPRMGAADARAIAGKLRQFVEGPRRIAENMTVVTPLVLPLPGNRAAMELNRRLLVRQIRTVLRGLPERPVQLWSFAPDVDFLLGRFDEECAVYYCVDEFSAFEGYDREAIQAAEARLAAKADLVVTTSTALYESKRPLNPNVMLVPHGVDAEHFARATRPETIVPEDIADLPRPLLGFWGLIQDWVDIDLLAEVARLRPQWSIVLIGEAIVDVGRLATLPNVHLLGRRPYAALPAYAKGFDVGMIPFRVNKLTRAVNPIKLREYLSAGLPVVSTPLPEVEQYREWAAIAGRPDLFAQACQRMLESTSQDEVRSRQAAMTHEKWQAKVCEIADAVTSIQPRTPRPDWLRRSHC